MTTLVSRRFLALLGGLLTVALLISSCTGGEGSTTVEQAAQNRKGIVARAPVASEKVLASSPAAQAIRERGVLLNGTEVGLPLLSQRNPATGQVTGFDATIAKMLAKYIIGEPNVKQVTATGQTRESLLQVGTVDVVVHAYTMTKERAKKVSFAGPYFVSGAAIATLKSTEGIAAPGDLTGKTVCAIEGSTHIDAIEEQAPQAKIETVKTAPECVQALESGKAAAYVHDLAILAGTAALNEKIKIADEPFTQEPYGIGIPNGQQAFEKLINDWLAKIQQKGLWQKAWDRSFGKVAGDTPEPPKIGTPPIG